MSRSEKRELVSRLKILILHLLKWQYQPDRRGASWRSSVYNARDALADLLNDSPSLKSQLAGAIETAHARAVRDAADETTLPAAAFPKACPWSFTQLSDPDFWPEN